MEKTCLVIAPASRGGILSLIDEAAKRHGLRVVDPNRLSRAGLVMSQIRTEIEKAAIVIADLTGKNPNVYYETAIAHLTKQPNRVVLIVRRGEEVGYDLQTWRLLEYEDSLEGAPRFVNELAEFVRQGLEGASGATFETIEGREERTRRLGADLNLKLHRSDDEDLSQLVIRFEGGLSALAISEREGGAEAYRLLLREERDAILGLLGKGAHMKAILAPRTLRQREDPETRSIVRARTERLFSVLEGKTDTRLDRLAVVMLEPGYVHNTYIIGDKILYEGIKASVRGGFDLTTRLTDEAQIAARIKAFDQLFEAGVEYTLESWGGGTPASALLRGLASWEPGVIQQLQSATLQGLKATSQVILGMS